MSKRNLIDTAALSDPTDTHSLEELRAHLVDEGMLTCDIGRHQWANYSPLFAGIGHWGRRCKRCGLDDDYSEQASERSGGDGA